MGQKRGIEVKGDALSGAKAAVVLLVGLKLYLMASANPFMDEAYYWMWGAHPALSYYDHPPLNAWLQALSRSLLGWNTLALRAMVIATFIGDIALIWCFAQRLGGERDKHFWFTLLLFVSMPMFFIVTSVALPDHVLVFCSLTALYFAFCFFEDWAAGQKTRFGRLYLAALFLGSAGLAKYNAALLGLALLCCILFLRSYRDLLVRPQLYLAGLLAIGLQAPVILWNMHNELASFRFILGGRHAGLSTSWQGVWSFAAGMLIFCSPFLLWPLARLLGWPGAAARNPALNTGRIVFAVSTLCILAVSCFTRVLFHWNIVALIGALPFLSRLMEKRFLYLGQAGYAAVFLAAMIVNFTLMPILSLSGRGDEASEWFYGWDETAAMVREGQADHPDAFLATSGYETASLLGFALRDPRVTSLSSRLDQYDFWPAQEAQTGANALILADGWRPLTASVRARFDQVSEIARQRVRRLDRHIDTRILYLGEGYRPAPEATD